MKIQALSVTAVTVPLNRVFKGSTYQIDTRSTLIVRIMTDEGLTSEIYSGDERDLHREIRALILGPFKDALIGEDPFATERHWHRLFSMTPHFGDKTVAMRAISAVDLALWDLVGKALNTPLFRLMGGDGAAVPIVGYGYFETTDPPELVCEDMLQQKALGCAGSKLKVGGLSIPEK